MKILCRKSTNADWSSQLLRERDDVIKFTLNRLEGLSETKDSRAVTGIALCEVNQACTQRIFWVYPAFKSNVIESSFQQQDEVITESDILSDKDRSVLLGKLQGGKKHLVLSHNKISLFHNSHDETLFAMNAINLP